MLVLVLRDPLAEAVDVSRLVLPDVVYAQVVVNLLVLEYPVYQVEEYDPHQQLEALSCLFGVLRLGVRLDLAGKVPGSQISQRSKFASLLLFHDCEVCWDSGLIELSQ